MDGHEADRKVVLDSARNEAERKEKELGFVETDIKSAQLGLLNVQNVMNLLGETPENLRIKNDYERQLREAKNKKKIIKNYISDRKRTVNNILSVTPKPYHKKQSLLVKWFHRFLY